MDSELRLHDILGCITDGVVQLDCSWRVNYLNPQAADMFRREPKELLDRHLWTEFPDWIGQPFHLACERAMREQQAMTVTDHHPLTDRWFENHLYPSPEGLTLLFRDITEAHQRDQALRSTQKLASLGLLTSGLAHDLNNLLGALMANLNLVELTLPPEDSSLKVRTHNMNEVLTRAAGLVRQMLTYAGRGESTPRHMNPNRIIKETTGMMAASLLKGVEIHLALAQDAAWITADEAQFQQVVLNLLTNAADAIGNGNGTILMATRNEHLDLARLERDFQRQGLEPGDYLCLEVTDTGCGMTEETLSHMFDPFFTTKSEGRGLGLSAMRGILKNHHGGLAIRSVPGQGTTFCAFFPVSGCTPDATPTPGTILTVLRLAGPVLVVDDEASLRSALAEYLTRQGLSVLQAADGIEALDILKSRHDFALVVLDLTMPRMGGLELLGCLRGLYPRLPVVLMSGYNIEPVKSDLLETTCTSFLSKPFTFRDLHLCILRLTRAES